MSISRLELIQGLAYSSNRAARGYCTVWDFRAVGAKIIHKSNIIGYALHTNNGEEIFDQITDALSQLCRIYECSATGDDIYEIIYTPPVTAQVIDFRQKTLDRGTAISQKKWDKLTRDNKNRDPIIRAKSYS